MARENYVFLIGQVKKPVVFKSDTEGNISKAQMVLTTVKRNVYDDAGMYTPKYDHLWVETSNSNIIKVCERIRPNDFIEIKGTVATKNIIRGMKCPTCGKITTERGVLDYIEPAYIGIRAHAGNASDGAEYLRQCSEASNIVKVIGTVCMEPSFYTYENGLDYANYDIAINRKLYVEGQPEISADFPWVKTFGEQARKDKEAIRLGSLVYIDGYIKAENAQKEVLCEGCGNRFTLEYKVTVIRPYSVEYLEGCHLPDQVVKELDDRSPDGLEDGE